MLSQQQVLGYQAAMQQNVLVSSTFPLPQVPECQSARVPKCQSARVLGACQVRGQRVVSCLFAKRNAVLCKDLTR